MERVAVDAALRRWRAALVVGLVVPPPASITPWGATRGPYRPSDAHVPLCAHAGRAIALPPRFPALFPLPPRTAITVWQAREGGFTVGGVVPTRADGAVLVAGVAPSRDFVSTARFFLDAPPRAGFATIESEAEPPSDAEGVYRGHGYLGRWVMHSLADCPHAVILSIFAEHA